MDNPKTSPGGLALQGKDASLDVQPPQLSLWRRMQIPVIAWAAYWLVRLLGPTMRVEVIGVHNAIQFRDSREPAIGAFWHRSIFPAIWIWRNRGIVVLNTVNFDGQWTRRAIERLGFGTVQGSSSRGGIAGLTAMAEKLAEGKHVAFTIDGPRGPRYLAKPGPVILARRTGKPISVFHIALERAHTFRKSWDLFQIPYPFSRAVMFIAPPILVPIDADSEGIKGSLRQMQEALERVRDAAETWFELREREKDCVRDEWRQPGFARRPVAAGSKAG